MSMNKKWKRERKRGGVVWCGVVWGGWVGGWVDGWVGESKIIARVRPRARARVRVGLGERG